MSVFPYELSPLTDPALGLIVLQTDERIEQDFRRLIPREVRLHITRIPSEPDVTPEALATMEAHIPAAARLLPRSVEFGAIGFGCTSGAVQIGAGRVHELVRQGVGRSNCAVSDPYSALIAACADLGLTRLAYLSPYVEPVSAKMRISLRAQGIETPVFGGFDEAEESKVVQITPRSILLAAQALAQQADVDGIFLSCTNLNTLDIIAPLQVATSLPVLSSNLVLAWQMCRYAGVSMALGGEVLG